MTMKTAAGFVILSIVGGAAQAQPPLYLINPCGQVTVNGYPYTIPPQFRQQRQQACDNERQRKQTENQKQAAVQAHIDEERAKIQAANEAQQRANDQHVAALIKSATDQGYQKLTFMDFNLDGKSLAATSSKVFVSGIYDKEGQAEFLYETANAKLQNTHTEIPIITDDAPRGIRERLYECSSAPYAHYSCVITVLGRMSMCELTTSFGKSERPCVVLDAGGGWW